MTQQEYIDQWGQIITKHFHIGGEVDLVNALMDLKYQIYQDFPKVTVTDPKKRKEDPKEKICQEWVVYLHDYAKQHPAEKSDFNYDFRLYICYLFCELYACTDDIKAFDSEVLLRASFLPQFKK